MTRDHVMKSFSDHVAENVGDKKLATTCGGEWAAKYSSDHLLREKAVEEALMTTRLGR
jgi:hypothetical protein